MGAGLGRSGKRVAPTEENGASAPSSPPRKKSWLAKLGPGLVAGAADDDPSGIATYSQAGAQFGTGQLWSVVLSFPLMVAIQLVAARIGRGTGKGIIAAAREMAPKPLLTALTLAILIVNTINIAADLAAMGEAVELIGGGSRILYAMGFGAFCAALEIFVPYRRYAPVLKALTLVLFVYVAVVLTVTIDWSDVLRATLMPSLRFSHDYLLTLIAVFGTTISPYVFVWQAAQETEDMRIGHDRPVARDSSQAHRQSRRVLVDTIIGMAFSNAIAFCIMLTAAVTLFPAGQHEIKTAAEAAGALRPLAGEWTFLLFAAGIIGTGLLAVPVLAGSAAYAVADLMKWHATLEARPGRARGFYWIIALATLGGATICLFELNPIRMLFWSAVINGFAAVPIMLLMMMIVARQRIMGAFVASRTLSFAGGLATALMTLAVFALIIANLI